MNKKTIATVALPDRPYPDIAAKYGELAQWIELAAAQGAELVVVPETINLVGAIDPATPPDYASAATADWQAQAAPLIHIAKQRKIGLTLPLLIRDERGLSNSCLFIGSDGALAGRYDKMYPTAEELEQGIRPGTPCIVNWEGLRVAGAICFDTEFQEVFDRQAAIGSQLFVVPSMWSGGRQLNYYATRYGVPIAVAYSDWCRIIHYDGTELAAGGHRWETLRFGFGSPVFLATINFDYVVLHADRNQERIRDVQRKYGKRVQIRFDQENTLFYLESLCTEIAATDIATEFGLVQIGDYFRRYRQLWADAATTQS